ncbi:hypothetical protein Tco_1445156, partial [Tanacetum coccineum]
MAALKYRDEHNKVGYLEKPKGSDDYHKVLDFLRGSHFRPERGKGVAVEEPTPTHDKTFKQLEEERLGWEAAQRLQAQELANFEKHRAESLMKDVTFARQMSQDFEMMVALVNTRRKKLVEQRAQERRERPMTPSQLKQYMRTYVKNQGPAVYSTGWTMAQVQKLSPEQLQEEFDKIQRAVAFTSCLKRDGSPMTSASSKKLKTGDDEVEVPSQKATIANVEVPSNTASIVQPTASSLKKVGTKKKRLGRKDSASDDDTPVNLYAVVDWELLPTGLGSINAFYRLDNSRKYFKSLREILYFVTRADLMTIYGRVMTFYQDKKAAGVGLVLWGDLK